MNALKCRTLATKMLLWTHTLLHKQTSLKSIITEQCVGVLSSSAPSDSYLNLWIYGQNSTDSWRTTHYDDGQSPRKKQSFKDTKVSVSMFSADIRESEEISRWRPIDKALHCDFSATKDFSKTRHNFLSEGLFFF